MKIQIELTSGEFEYANYILHMAIEQLKDDPSLLAKMDLTFENLEEAKEFRRKIAKAFIDSHRQNEHE